jgi:hypothetical protein
MSREVHVRFCERRGVRFPPATLRICVPLGAIRIWMCGARIETFCSIQRRLDFHALLTLWLALTKQLIIGAFKTTVWDVCSNLP